MTDDRPVRVRKPLSARADGPACPPEGTVTEWASARTSSIMFARGRPEEKRKVGYLTFKTTPRIHSDIATTQARPEVADLRLSGSQQLLLGRA